MSDPSTWSLIEAAGRIARREISARELACDRLDVAEAAQERLNAFIAIAREAALAAADRADAALAAGRPPGPLHGVPLAHKDMYDRAGAVTGCGSAIRRDTVASGTATVMDRLDTAGQVDLGRLNMSEFAMGPTGFNHHHGRAKNPIDPARIAGGSSSGTGVAVAAGLVFGGLGSDTGGSIRIPAACCGIVGFKPTQGRVSRHGVMPLSFSQDCVGPLARTVADARLLLDLIAGPDGRDPTCVPGPSVSQPRRALSDLRIGLASRVFGVPIAGCVLDGIDTARRALEAGGASFRDAPLVDLTDVGEMASVVAMSEAAAVHLDWLRTRPEDYGPQVRARLSQALVIPAPAYIRALQMRGVLLARVLDEVFSRVDALLLPVMPDVPPLSRDVDIGDGKGLNGVIAGLSGLSRPISYLGLPALALPVARGPGGLPVSVQIVGAPWSESLLADIGEALEERLALGPFTPVDGHPGPAASPGQRH